MNMQILFLDVETSGLSPFEDQILELGAVVVETDLVTLKFQEISEFNSLVQIRKTFDEKITRLTGITSQEVENAPNLSSVQANWEKWLSDFENLQFVCGHSIGFDLSFLKSENWFLPLDYKIIDTLDLCRILLGEFMAINQEYLCKKLYLNNFQSKHTHHRSLFDTKVNIRLLHFLLQKIHTIGPENEILQTLKNYFLPLPIDFFTISKNLQTKKLELNPKPIEIDFAGQFKQLNIKEKLPFLATKNLSDQIINLLQDTQDSKVIAYLLQFYFLNLAYLQGKNNLKLHFQNNQKDYQLVNILLEFLLPENLVETINKPDLTVILPKIESLTWKFNLLANQTIPIAKLLEIVDLWGIFLPNTLINLKKDLQIISNSFDFWILNVEKQAEYGKLNLNLDQLQDDFALKKTFLELQNKFQILNDKLKTINFSGINQLIYSKWQNYFPDFQFQSGVVTVYLRAGYWEVSQPKTGFSIQLALNRFFNLYSNLEITTHLPENHFQTWQKILKIQLPKPTVFPNNLNLEVVERVDLQEFFKEKITQAKEAKKVVGVFTGLGSGLKNSQNILTQSFHQADYLALGETGSKTKILSKLQDNFTGLVVLKFSDLDYFLSQVKTEKIQQLWVLQTPYLTLHPYLEESLRSRNDFFQTQNYLRKLYLISYFYEYLQKYGIAFSLINNYI